MHISKRVLILHPLPQVWRALSDIHLVAECLPGASITDDIGDNRYKGRFLIKLGPIAASFVGEVAIETQPMAHIGRVSGKGADARSSSRVSGSLSYRLTGIEPAVTQIEVDSEINLGGTLAQFNKLATMQEVTNRITEQFVTSLEEKLAKASSAAGLATTQSSVTRTEPLNVGKLAWVAIASRILIFVRWLLDRAKARTMRLPSRRDLSH